MAESVAIPTAAVASLAIPRPGFWERVVAFVIDLQIVSALNNVLQAIDSSGRLSWLSWLFALVYFVYFWSGNGGGRTWGMRAMGLRVVREDGSPLDLMRSVVRFLGLIVSCSVVLLGVIWVAFDAKKQGWHDKFAGSVVVAD